LFGDDEFDGDDANCNHVREAGIHPREAQEALRDADVVVMVNKLPQPLPGQRYELYLTSNGRTIDAGALKLVDRGRDTRQCGPGSQWNKAIS